MTDVVLVRDLTELGIVRQFFGDRMKDIQVYTLFPPRYLELTREGIEPNIFSQHISADEAYDIYHRVFRDVTRITDSFPEVEGELPVNLSRYFKIWYWQYLTEAYVLDIALKRILDRGNGVKVAYLQRSYRAVTSHAELFPADLIFAQMLDALSKQRPSIVYPLPGDTALEDTRWPILRDATKQPLLRSLKRMVRALLVHGRALNVRSAPQVTGGARTIAFGNSYDALVVLPDALRIAAETGRKPLWMTEGVDKDTIRSGLIYRDWHGQIERFSINQYLATHPVPPLTKSEGRQVDRLFTHMMEGLGQIEVVSRYSLTHVMSELRREFRHALWRTKVLDRVLARFTDSDIVVSNFNGLDERIIEQLAKRRGIKVYARPHGWMSNFEGFEFVADHYYCDGQLRAELVDKLYGYGERIKLSPDPSLLNVSREWLCKGLGEQQAIVAEKRAALSIEARYVILLMTTAARFRCALNEFDYAALLECWSTILNYLKSHPDVHVIVKSHKFNFDNWVAELAEERGVKNLTILGGRLEDAIITADLVVDLGKPGTATLSALLFQRPLLLYRGLYKYVREFGDLVHAAGASFAIDTPQTLIQEWETLRRSGNDYHLVELRERNRSLRDLLATSSSDTLSYADMAL
jgi:hypothetical protein